MKLFTETRQTVGKDGCHEAVIRRKRTMIIVGPGHHFGIELVNEFLESGFYVGVVCSSQISANSFANHFTNTSDRVQVTYADVTNVIAFGTKLAELAEALPQLECLIYNAKNQVKGNGLQVVPSEFSRSVSVDLTGAVTSVQAVLPRLRLAKNGLVIITGGGFKDKPNHNKFSLSVTKAGLHNLALALAAPLSTYGIRVKTIVIDGAVRRSYREDRSSKSLARLYLRAFSDTQNIEYNFPPTQSYEAATEQGVLKLELDGRSIFEKNH